MTNRGHARWHSPSSNELRSDAAALWRAAAVVRDRRHIADRRDVEANGGQRTQRRFTARPGSLNFDFDRLDPMFLRLAARIFRGHLSGIGVDFREPLKPMVPADDQAIALP